MARELTTEGIERVVVRGANWVGDAVMTVPALRELRRVLPGARLTLATRAWAEGIFAGADFIGETAQRLDAIGDAVGRPFRPGVTCRRDFGGGVANRAGPDFGARRRLVGFKDARHCASR